MGTGILASGVVRGNVRQVCPCLSKPAQRYIARFETLAQLALLQATHSRIGGGRYSFSSGIDSSAAEAGINKMFATSWPLQIFVQLVASWAHAKNVLLQPTHLPGRYNEWADDLSRNRLGRFAHRPWPEDPAAMAEFALKLQASGKWTDESRCIEVSAMPSHCLSLCFVPPQVQPRTEKGDFAPWPQSPVSEVAVGSTEGGEHLAPCWVLGSLWFEARSSARDL